MGQSFALAAKMLQILELLEGLLGRLLLQRLLLGLQRLALARFRRWLLEALVSCIRLLWLLLHNVVYALVQEALGLIHVLSLEALVLRDELGGLQLQLLQH